LLPRVKVAEFPAIVEDGTLTDKREPEVVSALTIDADTKSRVTETAAPSENTTLEDVRMDTEPRSRLLAPLANFREVRLELNDDPTLLHTMLVPDPASASVSDPEL
jgi:hypothetical protein